MNIEQMVRYHGTVDHAGNEQPDLTDAKAEAQYLDGEIAVFRSRCRQSFMRIVLCIVLLAMLIGFAMLVPIELLVTMLARSKPNLGQTTALDWVYALLMAAAPVYGAIRYYINYVGFTKELKALVKRRELLDDGTSRELRKREALRQALESWKRQ